MMIVKIVYDGEFLLVLKRNRYLYFFKSLFNRGFLIEIDNIKGITEGLEIIVCGLKYIRFLF